jgi:hypothetical protein
MAQARRVVSIFCSQHRRGTIPAVYRLVFHMWSWWCSVVLQRGLQLGNAYDSASTSLRSALTSLTNGYNQGFFLAILIESVSRWT